MERRKPILSYRRRRNVYDKKSQRYANKQHLIVRSYKSVAYVTNNKDSDVLYCWS